MSDWRSTFGKTIEAVVEEMRQKDGVEAVLVSGSAARGDLTPYSDLDIHVVIDEGYEDAYQDEDLSHSRLINGLDVEIEYATAALWRSRITDQTAEPR